VTDSAIYHGKVYHERFLPTQHKFSYDINLFWLALRDINTIASQVDRFTLDKWGPAQFRRSDYLGPATVPLEDAVLEKMNTLSETPLEGDVFMLGQLRTWGIYFSPVNFYYLKDTTGTFTHLLAEVSNTPWNERHYYLVDLDTQSDTQKAFHVSPFNPMDMQYKWRITQPSTTLSLVMDCVREDKEFSAGINLSRMPLDNANLSKAIKRIPSMTIKTVIGIYWQALKLFIKRTPLYSHPEKSQEQ